MFLQSHSSIYIFTDSIFFICVYFNSLAFVFSEPFPMFPMRFANSNGQLQSRISLSAIADGFALFFGQHKPVGRSLTFRVSAYK